MRIPHHRAAVCLVSAWILASLAGCECSTNVGTNRGDVGFDARPSGPRADECGNGLDDDENGLIDDFCPCAPGETQRCFSGALASNDIGACMGGTQTCVASGSEWGDWGDSDCDGEVLPATEACDGSDADCDGAIDEGCPCTDGATRGCGDEFTVAPCRAGTQRCRGGTWSSCEGAVGPMADVCTDAIDNDCDGLTNEGCECAYPPTPEVCRDAVDNDCDGVIDEPECTPDWPRDAGVPHEAGMDAGPPPGCAGVETCGNGLDDDCDGRIDDGCEVGACPCAPDDYTFERARVTSDLARFSDFTGVTSAWSGRVHGVLYTATPSDVVGPFDVYLARFDDAGTQLGFSPITSFGSPIESVEGMGLVWTGASFVAMVQSGTTVQLLRIAEDGTLLGTPVTVSTDSRTGGLAWNGRELGVAFSDARQGRFQRFDRDLGVIDPVPVALGTPSGSLAFLAHNVDWMGSRWLVRLQPYGAPSGATFVLLDGATVRSTFTLPDAGGDYWLPVATNGEGQALTCTLAPRVGYDRSSPARCYRIDELSGVVGAPTVIDGGPFEFDQMGIFWWRCAYVVVLPGNNDTTPDAPFDVWETGRLVQIGTDGSLTDLPRPPRDAADPGAPYLNWHFHVRWQSVGYSPDVLLFSTRWFTPYWKGGRMRLTCNGG